jgi:hypothetical protein
MTTIRRILALFLLATASTASFADPITDGVLNPYKAGWFSNVIGGRALPCPQACEIAAKTAAEFEAAPGESLKKSVRLQSPGRPGRQKYHLSLRQSVRCAASLLHDRHVAQRQV